MKQNNNPKLTTLSQAVAAMNDVEFLQHFDIEKICADTFKISAFNATIYYVFDLTTEKLIDIQVE